MRILLLLYLISVLLLQSARGQGDEAAVVEGDGVGDDDALPKAEVVILTSETFEHETQAATGATTGDWFVKFYAPWCGHCVRLAPTWDELAGALSGKVNVAKVDVTASRDVGQRFGVTGFPTLLFFKDGFYYRFKGRRELPALTEFVLGGYKSVEPTKVPKANPTLLERLPDFVELFHVFMHDWEGLKKGNLPSEKGLAVMVSVGALLLIVMIAILYLLPGKKSTKKGKKTK